jgi:hypothetical protein
MKRFVAGLVAVVLGAVASAQEPPKPGPEHELLKKHVGEWALTMKAGGQESKGTASYAMDLGGLWLVSSTKFDLFGQAYTGRGLDTYDPATKKYVAVWVDSMATRPLVLEGTYDAATKTLTMSGKGPGIDGTPTEYKSVTTFPDADTIEFAMHMGGGKEPAFTISYKRKK